MLTSFRTRATAFLKDIRDFCSANKKTFLYLFFIYVFGILSLIRANYLYLDDMGRALLGNPNYTHSRVLSNFLSTIIHASRGVWDISPLPQVIAMVVMAVAGCIVIHLLSEKRGFRLWTIIAAVPLALSPYFLQCISYKFDAPYMAISVLTSVLPFLFRRYGFLSFCAVSVAGCLVMCTTYQSSSGIYPMLATLLFFLEWKRGRPWKELFSFCGMSILSYVVAMLIFKFHIMPKPRDAGYISENIGTLSDMLRNLRTYFSYIFSDFESWWLALVGFMVGCFVYIAARDVARGSGWGFRLLSAVLAVITLLVMALMSYGAYILLEKPLFAPRGLYGFSVLIAFVGVYLTGAEKTYPAKLACLWLSWGFLIFSFVYGNALSEAQRYADFRVQSVVEDLKDMDILMEAQRNGEKLRVQVVGHMDKSPILTHSRAYGNYQILLRMVPYTFYYGQGWNDEYFLEYMGLADYIQVDRKEDFTALDLPVLKDTIYHTIRGGDSCLLIEVKK